MRNVILQKCPDEVKHQIPAEPEVCTELIRRARPRFDCVMLALTRMWLQKTIENSAIYSFGIAASPGPPVHIFGVGWSCSRVPSAPRISPEVGIQRLGTARWCREFVWGGRSPTRASLPWNRVHSIGLKVFFADKAIAVACVFNRRLASCSSGYLRVSTRTRAPKRKGSNCTAAHGTRWFTLKIFRRSCAGGGNYHPFV
jgi:hypothetical protein